MGVRATTIKPKLRAEKVREFAVHSGRAISAIKYMKPHFVKFQRMANLLLALFKYHTYIPINKFDGVVIMLFGTYLTPKEANDTLLKMTPKEYREFMKTAEELTNTYLR